MGQYCTRCGLKFVNGVCPNCEHTSEPQEQEREYLTDNYSAGRNTPETQQYSIRTQRRVDPLYIVIMVLSAVIISLISFMTASCLYGNETPSCVGSCTANQKGISEQTTTDVTNTTDNTEANATTQTDINGNGTYNNPSCGYFDRYNYYCTGDHLLFGSYEQDADTSNGKEAIEWTVLDNQKGKLVLISSYCLDCKTYNNACASLTWDKCTLRTWLNGDFYNTAFNSDEKNLILQVKNINADNPNYNTSGGNTTHDKVYCLRIGEARKYFPDDKSRKAEVTLYAQQTDAYKHSDSGRGWWWLRSPGSDNFNAATVLDSGEVFPAGYLLHSTDGCVRPVITIQM